MISRRSGKLGLVLILAPAASILALSLTGRFTSSELRFDVGPNTGSYLRGFTDSEERPPVSFRWSGEHAFISLPFRAQGVGRLELRAARFLPSTARIHWSTDGRASPAFDVRSGRFRTFEIELAPAANVDTSLDFELSVEDSEPSQLGVAVDWIRLRGLKARPDFRRLAAWSAPLLILGILGIGVLCGLGPRLLAGVGAIIVVATALWFHLDAVGMMHALPSMVVPALLLGAVAAWWQRGRAGWLLAIIMLCAFVSRGAALLHPSFFYPDVRNHRRYVTALAEAEGSWVDRGLSAQKRVHTAYPRNILGKDYALPYSPLFFVPFTVVGGEHDIENALKMVSLLFATLEIPILFLIAKRLWGTRAALATSSILAVSFAMTSRLTLAMFPTIAGHLVEMATLAIALVATGRLHETRQAVRYAFTGLMASLTYVTSLINLSLFTLALAAGMGRKGLRLLWWWIGVGVSTIALLYLPFVRIVWYEILPKLGATASIETPVAQAEGGVALAAAVGRAPLFFGWPALILAAWGGWLALRERSEARRWLLAYAATLLMLVALRAFSGGLFKDLKEILFAAPLVALLAARAVEALFRRGVFGWLAGGAALAGLLAWGIASYAALFARLTELAGSG